MFEIMVRRKIVLIPNEYLTWIYYSQFIIQKFIPVNFKNPSAGLLKIMRID